MQYLTRVMRFDGPRVLASCAKPPHAALTLACLLVDVLTTRRTFSRFVVGVKREKICDRLRNATRHSFKFLKRRCIPSAFNQTQKIDRDTHNLGEFLLRPIRFVANLADSESELFF